MRFCTDCQCQVAHYRDDTILDDEIGPAAAWWEEWEDQHPSSRKRRHPTSQPTAEDEQQDQPLANMSTEVSIEVAHSIPVCYHFPGKNNYRTD